MTGNINTSTQTSLTSATFFGTSSLKPVNENKANMSWDTTEEQLLHYSRRKKPTRRGKKKPQTAILISMHVLRFAQLPSDWPSHNKPVRMKQNCSWKVRETPLLPPWKKKKKKGKLKHHILPFSGSADHIRFHSSLIPVHFGIFRCHSGSFRCIPVPFLSIPFHFGVILPCSGIFRLIPVYSVPFNSVPVFSNARTFQKTCHVPCQAASCQKPTCHVAPRT